MTTRRELIKRTAVVGGLAWTAPAILSVTRAAAVTCACTAFTKVPDVNGGLCTALPAGLGGTCTVATTALTSALGACTSNTTDCANYPFGLTIILTGTAGTVVFPAGTTPVFLGVRYNQGCVWLDCDGSVG